MTRITILLNITSLLVILATSSGCTGMTERECRFADFGEIGYADATEGKLREEFNKYHKKCLSYDIDLSEEIVMYDMGRERGLLNYCNEVKYSSQCDRGSNDGSVKSYQHINSEMTRIISTIPQISTSISR